MVNGSNQKGRGFTIIEVMIVLTIAGLILLIVFLAVPALQRNSRNTQRKRDVGIYVAAIREWSGSNGSALPSAATDLTDPDGVNSLAKLIIYDSPIFATKADTVSLDLNTFRYVYQGECDVPENGKAHAKPNTKQFAIRYALESGSNSTIEHCQDF